MIEAQLISAVIAWLFLIVALFSGHSTYRILAALYSVNAAAHLLYSHVPTYSEFWPVLYSTLDVSALVLITSFGDKRIKFNASCLTLLVFAHTLVAWDIIWLTDIVFNQYIHIVMTIITIQLLMGFWDAATELRRIHSVGYPKRKLHHNAENYNESNKT